jgi:hypothetical protein
MITKHIKTFKEAANELAFAFAEKQGFDPANFYWIGEVGTGIFACIDQYYYSMEDIIYDLQNNVKRGTALKWIDAVVDYECNNIKKGERQPSMNYKAWCMGVRFKKKFGY